MSVSGFVIHAVGGSTRPLRVRYTGIADRTEELRSSAAHATSVSCSRVALPLPHDGVAHCAGQPSHGEVTTAAIRCWTGPVGSSRTAWFGSPGRYVGPTESGFSTVVFGVAPAPVNHCQKLTFPLPVCRFLVDNCRVGVYTVL